MTSKDYETEATHYKEDINTEIDTYEFYTNCVVCNKQIIQTGTLCYYGEKVNIICDECKEAIKWAKEKMNSDKQR